jgi:hypothetical protein
LLAEGADSEGVVAFGESEAVFVAEEMGVEVAGCREVEGALEEDLARGGFEEVGTTDYFGDLGVGVVDDAGQLVAGDIVATPDEEVAEVFASGEGLRTEVEVGEDDGFAFGDAEAVVAGLLVGERRRWVRGAAMAVVDGLVVLFFVRGVHHEGEVSSAAATGVDAALLEKTVEG